MEDFSMELRSILMSEKGGTLIDSINKLFYNINGENIDYRKLGYKSIFDAVRAVQRVRTFRTAAGWMADVIPDEKTSHIADLVAKQKPKKVKRPARSIRRIYPVQRRPNIGNHNSNSKFTPACRPYVGARSVRIPPAIPAYQAKAYPTYQASATRHPQFSQQVPLARRDATVTVYPPKAATPVKPPTPVEPVPTRITQIPSDVYKRSMSVPTSQNQTQSSAPPIKRSPSDRLKVTRPPPIEIKNPIPEKRVVSPTLEVRISNTQSSFAGPPTPPQDQDPREMLKRFVNKVNLPQPEYKPNVQPIKNKRGTSIYSSVTIGPKNKYSSYPHEADNEVAAQKIAATKALEDLYKKYGSPIKLIVTIDKQLVQERIIAIVDVHSNGVFVDQLPDYYMRKHNECLPDHWITIIMGCAGLMMEKGAGDSLIVRRYDPEVHKGKEPLSPRSQRTLMNFLEAVPVKLILPEDSLWPVHVTYVNSTTDVYVRLLEDEYNDKFYAMEEAMKKHYSQVDKPSGVVDVFGYYVIEMDDAWHRVRVEELDPITGEVLIYFIDIGDKDIVDSSLLLPLEKCFCIVAPQAIRVYLANLEEMSDCDTVTSLADKLLFDRALFMEVTNREMDGIGIVTTGVFYDTSGENDINLNEVIMEKLVDHFELQQFNENEQLDVSITHVDSNGHVFVQINNDGMKILSKMMTTLVDSGMTSQDITKASVRNPVNENEVFLVRGPDGNWVRAKVLQRTGLSVFRVIMLDYGRSIDVECSNMLRLQVLSEMLAKYPAQVTKIVLHGVTSLDDKMVNKLKALAPSNERLICKVVNNSEVLPVVELFRRNRLDNGVTSINHSLILRLESAMTDEDTNNNVRPKRRLERSHSRQHALKNDNFKKLRPPTIPPVGTCFDVHVTTLAANPGNFVVQPRGDAKQLQLMMKNLQTSCQSYNGPPVKTEMLGEGKLYAVRHDDGLWHRACLTRIMGEQSVVAYLCDYGNITVTTIDQLQPLGSEFLELPYQAIRAKLVGIRPLNVDWSLETCLRFRELVVDKYLVSIIKQLDGDDLSSGDPVLGLELIDTGNDQEDVYIHRVLIEEDMAISDSP